MIRPATTAFALTLGVMLSAQAPGSNDATFNPGDQGHAVGDAMLSATVDYGSIEPSCVVIDPQGRTIWAGTRTFMVVGDPVIGFVERRNADGSVDTSFHFFNQINYGEVEAVALQADGKILVGGAFQTSAATGYRDNLIRLNSDGSLDTTLTNNPSWGVGARVRAITEDANGKILIGGTFSSYLGSSVSNLTRLNSNGTRDASWFTGTYGGTNGAVHAICVQPDGKVLLGGDFTQAAQLSRARIARIDPTNGGLSWWDNTFVPGTGCNAVVRSIALRSDGRIMLGGDFTSVAGTACGRIVRLTAGGAVDATFVQGSGFNASVRSVSVRDDLTTLVAGDFTSYAGTVRNRAAVVNDNGSLNAAFDVGIGPNLVVKGSLTLPDGKVVLVGSFTVCNGVVAGQHIRLAPNGGIDNTFSYNGANGALNGVGVQSDGRIIIGGRFYGINGLWRRYITRLMPDGSLDASFTANSLGNTSHIDDIYYHFSDLVVQPDDKIVVGGGFSAYVGGASPYVFGLVRLLANGAVDATFNAGLPATKAARAISIGADGKILASYASLDADVAPNAFPSSFKRFNADGSTDATFTAGTAATGVIEDSGILPDGRILIAGGFTNYASSGRNHILRLNTDGTIDGTFNYLSGFVGGVPKYLLLTSDGKCIVSGTFTSFDGHAVLGICRLNGDGTFDTTFSPGAQGGGPLAYAPEGKIIVGARHRLNLDGSLDATFYTGTGFSNAYGTTEPKAVVLQPDGDIVAVGDFTAFNGMGRNRIARLNGTPTSNLPVIARILLEGPYDQATQTMSDGLRSAELIPGTEPFTALGFTRVGEPLQAPVPSSVFNVAVPAFNSIVDWAMVELRSATQPDLVLQTRTGLLQRDGDIVALNGTSILSFNSVIGSYHISVRHRNHLACMTAAPVALSTTTTVINFTLPTTATYGTDARKAIGPRMVLHAGNACRDNNLRYTGASNDRDPILVKVGGTTPNNTAAGYFLEDVTMDGTVKYTGAGNDRDPILVNIGSTAPNNVRVEQLP